MSTATPQKTIRLSEKASTVKDSITMAITALAAQMTAEGTKVLSFSAGEPDFDTPQNIKQAGINAIKAGKTKYTAASGIIELKKAVCKKLKQDTGLTYGPENIVITCGAKHAIYNAFMAVLNPGDEVLIPTPYWVSYPDQAKLVGAIPVLIETTDKAEFKITPDQLEKAITPKTRLLILNSPSNPTGSIYTQAELEDLAEIILKYQIMVLSDEIYEKLIYDGEKHISIATLSPRLKALTLLVDGVAKSHSMTGWRIGYIAAEAPIAKAMGQIQSHTTSNPTTPAQWAALEALEGPQATVQTMKKEFDTRRKIMVESLNAIPGITCLLPKGAFYTFPNISSCYGKKSASGLITDSVTFCANLLKEEHVACVPGSGFGADNHIRLSYATSLNDIKEGIKKIARFVSSLA